MIAGTLEIQLMANMARLAKDMHDARRSVSGAMDAIEQSVASAKAALGAFAAGFSAIQAVHKLVDVQREFDVLNAGLITATGSVANAKVAFASLQQFAATTPFSLAQTTEAFIKMRNLGLDPSEAALRSYGNTASAMGKGLNQFIEAIADASTGEFERLKEFGIKTQQQGDTIALTFQGVTTKIGKNSTEIQKYLKAIGDNQFAGAMDQRAKTLDGALSNLGDTWDSLFRKISEQNVGGVIYASVIVATGAIQDLITILKALDKGVDSSSQKTGHFSAIQESIAKILETIAVLGLNVSYVLKGIGSEIGGLAAQAAAIARLDFSSAKAIHEMMVADAEKARKQVDDDTARILSARQVASSGVDPSLGKFGIKPTNNGPSAAALKAANDELEKQRKLIAELAGLSGSFGEDWARLGKIYQSGKLSLDGLIDAQAKLLAEQPAIKAAHDEQANAIKGMADAGAKEIEQIADQVKKQREQNAEIGMSTEQIAELAAKKLELEAATDRENAANLRSAAIYAGPYHDAYIQFANDMDKAAKLKDQLAVDKRAGGAAQVFIEQQKKAAEDAQKVWDNFTENVQRNLGDGLYDALQGNFDSIGDAFKSMLFRMIADAEAADITNALFGKSAGGAGGAGGMSALIGAIGSAFGGGYGSWGVMNAGVAASNGLSLADLAGAFADGGNPPVGQVSLVGERGPELFVPKTSGTIIPNDRLGGSDINVNIYNSAGDQVRATAKPSADGMGLDVMVDMVDNAMADRIGAGVGSTSAALQNRYGLRPSMGY